MGVDLAKGQFVYDSSPIMWIIIYRKKVNKKRSLALLLSRFKKTCILVPLSRGKTGSDKRRFIVNLSWPENHSVNAGVVSDVDMGVSY